MKADGVYLLAAGRGKRAGGPKAWLEHKGRPLLARQLDFLLELFAPSKIAVAIQAQWEGRCRVLSADVRWTAADPDARPLASLQTLLKARRPAGWFFVYHVDMPLFDADLFRLLDGAAAAAEDAVVPTYGGRGGHPVLLAPHLAAEILALDAERDRLDRFLGERKVLRLDTANELIFANLNAGR